MAISAGDVVLNFLGDTTQLDAAFERVNTEAAAKIAPAAVAIQSVGNAAVVAGEELDATGENAAYAGELMDEAGKKGAISMREARGEVMLLNKELGLGVDRHLAGFLVSLPAVGKAMEAAFSATAVLLLLDLLVKGTEKLADWASSTFIFTQAMKDSNESVKATNKVLLELEDQIAKDKKAADDFGKTPLQLKTEKLLELQDELTKNEAKFAAASKAATAYAHAVQESKPEQAAEQLGQLNAVLGAVAGAFAKVAVAEKNVFDSIKAFFTGGPTPAEMKAEADKVLMRNQADAAIARDKIIDDKQKIRAAAKILTAQEVEDQQAASSRVIALSEEVGMTKIKIWEANAKFEAASAQDGAEATLKVEREVAEKIYQLKLQTLEREKAAERAAAGGFQTAGDTVQALKAIAQVKSTNAKIEALNAEHYAKEKALAAQTDEAILKLHADAAVMAQTIAKGFFPNLPEDTRNVLSMNDAAAKLGITLSKDVAKGVEDAKKALAVMDLELKAGKINTIDHTKAKLALVQAEIQLALATGKSTVALQHEEKALQKEIPEVKSSTTTHKDLQSVLTKTDAAFNTFVIDAVSGSASIGQAAMNMAKQMIQALVAYAEKKGAADLAQGFSDLGDPFTASLAPAAFEGAALWFALAGAGAVAEGLLSRGGSAGGGSGGGGGSSINTGSTTNQTATNPVQQVNVTHLAGGGLVSQQTLAIVGDGPSGLGNAREAVIPLDDSTAIRAIAEALGENGAGVTHNWYVNGMVSPDNLGKMAKKLSRNVQTGRVRLLASNSSKLTRKA